MKIETLRERIKKIRNSQTSQHRTIVEALNGIVDFLEQPKINDELQVEAPKKSYLEKKKEEKSNE